MTASLPLPGSAGAWLLAARPKTLTAAVAPVLVGAAVGSLSSTIQTAPAARVLWGLPLCVLGALCLQVGTNFVNDAADHARGADDSERLGPPRAVALGLLSARQAWRGALIAFSAAVCCGIGLAALAGSAIVIIGLASIAAGWAYTAGPFPLAYNALGELFVMIFFGFVAVCGTSLVISGQVPLEAWRASLVPGAMAAAILVVNNVRDEPNDRRVGKRTLPVIFGRGFGVAEFIVLLAIGYGMPIYLWRQSHRLELLLPLLSAPWGAWLAAGLIRQRGAALNRILAGTAQLMIVHCALFALAIWLCRR